MQKIGNENVKELVVFAVALGTATGKSLEDGSPDWTDLPNFLPVLKAVGPAVQDVGEVPAELRDLDEAEKAEIYSAIEALEVPAENVEKVAEAALRIGVDLAAFVFQLGKMREAAKAGA